MKNKEMNIDARRSSIYFFSVIFLMFLSIFVMLLTPDAPYHEHFRYMHLYLLIPVVLVKVGLPNSKLAKWMAERVIIYKIR